jgi:hypothetical protein
MADLRILVWKNPDPVGDPEVEVRIPAALAKWVPRMMALVPKKTKRDVWGEDFDFKAIFANVEGLIAEAASKGTKEIMDVKTKESHIKLLVSP